MTTRLNIMTVALAGGVLIASWAVASTRSLVQYDQYLYRRTRRNRLHRLLGAVDSCYCCECKLLCLKFLDARAEQRYWALGSSGGGVPQPPFAEFDWCGFTGLTSIGPVVVVGGICARHQ
jgi:hypothetical protein